MVWFGQILLLLYFYHPVYIILALYGHVETDQLKSYNLIMIECLHHSCGLHHPGRVSTSVGVSGAVHLTNVVAAAVLHHH